MLKYKYHSAPYRPFIKQFWMCSLSDGLISVRAVRIMYRVVHPLFLYRVAFTLPCAEKVSSFEKLYAVSCRRQRCFLLKTIPERISCLLGLVSSWNFPPITPIKDPFFIFLASLATMISHCSREDPGTRSSVKGSALSRISSSKDSIFFLKRDQGRPYSFGDKKGFRPPPGALAS